MREDPARGFPLVFYPKLKVALESPSLYANIDEPARFSSQSASTGRPCWAPVSFGKVCMLVNIQTIIFGGAVAVVYCTRLSKQSRVLGCDSCFEGVLVHEENQRLKAENDKLKQQLKAGVDAGMVHPYTVVTGSLGHDLPQMYGKVIEKTIWSYWHDPIDCPNSTVCTLPPQIQLCVETVRRNRGSFDYRIVHMNEIEDYVNWLELPLHFKTLKPPHQKDALMNALLARYGGVALDISTVLLRPIDDYWDEMVSRRATFHGYMYRINGQSWRHAEVSVVWFLMTRREGIFSTAVRNQVIGMGDKVDTNLYHHWYLALGDQTLLPILSMYNYTLPKCYEDPAIKKYHRFPDQNPNWCPENEQPP